MKPLLDQLAGKSVLIRSVGGPLEAALLGAFVTARAHVSRVTSEHSLAQELERLHRSHSPAFAVIVPFAFQGSMEANAEEAFELIHLIQEAKRVLGAPPRYAVGIAPADAAPGARVGRAIAKTLACYAAAHASELDLRVNVLSLEGAPSPRLYARASSASLALTSGWLDAVRGQELIIGEN